MLEKILEEIEKESSRLVADSPRFVMLDDVERIIRSHMEDDGWIPADQPPETDNYILLSFENFSVPMVGRYDRDEEGGAYYLGDGDESCLSLDVIVNAWQPLPEPYRPKEKN